MKEHEKKLYRKALLLAYFTICYNLFEGVVSMILGYSDETLALFGFGVDSFIEVVSGIGIAVMIGRIRKYPDTPKSNFEINALKITGSAFYILTTGLIVGIIINLANHHKPVTSIWGVVISLVSILVMVWLVFAKKNVGSKLSSDPIIADANCTKVCVYMSIVLLASSLIYEFTGFSYADSLGAAGLAYFSFTEGKEAFEKAKGKSCSCSESCSDHVNAKPLNSETNL